MARYLTDKLNTLQKNERCPFCQGLSKPHWPAVKIWRCQNCRLLFKHPMPTGVELSQLYRKSWTNPEEHANEVGNTDLELARKYIHELAKSLHVNDFIGLRILEFGAGSGAMLTALSEAGADVYGIEPYGYDKISSLHDKVYHTLDELPENLRFYETDL